MTITTVHILDDKYAIKHEDGMNIRATRYNEEWRTFVGDKLMYMLVTRFAELEDENRKMRQLLEAVDEHGHMYVGFDPNLNKAISDIEKYIESIPK